MLVTVIVLKELVRANKVGLVGHATLVHVPMIAVSVASVLLMAIASVSLPSKVSTAPNQLVQLSRLSMNSPRVLKTAVTGVYAAMENVCVLKVYTTVLLVTCCTVKTTAPVEVHVTAKPVAVNATLVLPVPTVPKFGAYLTIATIMENVWVIFWANTPSVNVLMDGLVLRVLIRSVQATALATGGVSTITVIVSHNTRVKTVKLRNVPAIAHIMENAPCILKLNTTVKLPLKKHKVWKVVFVMTVGLAVIVLKVCADLPLTVRDMVSVSAKTLVPHPVNVQNLGVDLLVTVSNVTNFAPTPECV